MNDRTLAVRIVVEHEGRQAHRKSPIAVEDVVPCCEAFLATGAIPASLLWLTP